MTSSVIRKFNHLKKIIHSLGSAVVAYSGGVDSTFLLKVCADILNEKVLAVIGDSFTLARREKAFAIRMAKTLKVAYTVIVTREVNDKNFLKNDKDRCYWCKRELFSRLRRIANKRGYTYVVDGSNFDDYKDYRPGLKAKKELDIRSPLAEARLRKDDIRLLSQRFGLPTWDKPALSCLSSRVPYNTPITRERINRIERAENYLYKLGFSQVRVRDYQELARIEVLPTQFSLFFNELVRKKILRYLRRLGYIYITFDLQGYLSGSMNKVIKKE